MDLLVGRMVMIHSIIPNYPEGSEREKAKAFISNFGGKTAEIAGGYIHNGWPNYILLIEGGIIWPTNLVACFYVIQGESKSFNRIAGLL
jgi:hypothetical protein